MSWKVMLLALALLSSGCGTEVIDLWPESPRDALVDHRADAGQADAIRPDSVAPPTSDLSSDRGSISPTGKP